jgi:hypothetical protein
MRFVRYILLSLLLLCAPAFHPVFAEGDECLDCSLPENQDMEECNDDDDDDDGSTGNESMSEDLFADETEA